MLDARRMYTIKQEKMARRPKITCIDSPRLFQIRLSQMLALETTNHFINSFLALSGSPCVYTDTRTINFIIPFPQA